MNCLTEKYTATEITWQWLLGRLYIIERLVKDFPTEFLPRQRPDGASSESSLELIGATSKGDEERPQNYDRLLTVAEFALKAVSNQHARISRVAKRVFLLAARYAAYLETLITEFFNLLNELDYTHKKSLKRQLEKIVTDYQLSEQLGRNLHVQNLVDGECSPIESASGTPLSSPKCVSPVTVLSDIPSETGSLILPKNIVAPPNTPIRDRRVQKTVCLLHSDSLDTPDNLENAGQGFGNYGKLKSSKSLDDLDYVDAKPRSRFSKSPVGKKSKSRSRSTTPQRIGPVLETNLDDVIRLEEEAKQRRNSYIHSDHDDSVFDEESDILVPPNAIVTLSPLQSTPSSRLVSNDYETDIDCEDLDIDSLYRKRLGSADLGNGGDKVKNTNLHASSPSLISSTPKMKLTKIPKNLALDLSPSSSQKSKRSISPCAHVLEFEKLSGNRSRSPVETVGPSLTFQSKSLSCSSRKSLNRSDKSINASDQEYKLEAMSKSRDCSGRTLSSSCGPRREKMQSVSGRSDGYDSINDHMAMTPCSGTEKPVTFKTEVAMATPKHSPSHTLDRGKAFCEVCFLLLLLSFYDCVSSW